MNNLEQKELATRIQAMSEEERKLALSLFSNIELIQELFDRLMRYELNEASFVQITHETRLHEIAKLLGA